MPSIAVRKPLLFALVTGVLISAWHEYSQGGRHATPPTGPIGRQERGGGLVASMEAGGGRETRDASDSRDAAVSTVAEFGRHPGRPAPLPWSDGSRSKGDSDQRPGAAAISASRVGPPSRRTGTAEDTGDHAADQRENAPISSGALPPLRVPFSLIDPERPATIPAALASDAAEGGLSPDATAEKARLAGGFVDRVGEDAGDARNPAYQQRWMEAQEESDTRMRASLGGHAWLRHHQAAHREALEAQEHADERSGTAAADD